jgi:hypothetical protein
MSIELASLFRSTLGQSPNGFNLLHEVIDSTRHISFYLQEDELLVAFWPTLGNLYIEQGESSQHWFKEAADWLKNAEFWKKSLTVGSKTYQAHAGFVEEYLSFRSDIMKQIEAIKPKQIFLTGFSQGGAHATLCHRDLLHNYSTTKVSTTVFASPKVYGMSGASEFDKVSMDKIGYDFKRVEMWGDPIPKLAPWFLNYFHVGSVIKIGNKNNKNDIAKWHQPDAYINALGFL